MRALEALNDEKSDSAPQLIGHNQSEINKIYQQALFKEVQTLLDRNANEYLKLSAQTHNEVERQNIKKIFQKKNLIIFKHLSSGLSEM
jgi:hypothetical protein